MRVADFIVAGECGDPAYSAAIEAADAADIAAVLALVGHEDPDVRREVASTLPSLTPDEPPTAAMVDAEIRLTGDIDPRVRDFACFALGTQWPEVDTPSVRAALAARLEMAAAAVLADPQLHDLVQRHQTGWEDAAGARTAEVARRLTDPAGVGDDVLDGVAELYRRRAHGRPIGPTLGAWHLMLEMLDHTPRRAPEFLREVLARVAGDDAATREVRENSALVQEAAAVEADRGA